MNELFSIEFRIHDFVDVTRDTTFNLRDNREFFEIVFLIFDFEWNWMTNKDDHIVSFRNQINVCVYVFRNTFSWCTISIMKCWMQQIKFCVMILLLINTWKCEWFDAIEIVIVCWIIFSQCFFFRSTLLMTYSSWMNNKHDFRIKEHKIVWKSSRSCTIVKRWCISFCVHVNDDFWDHFFSFWSKFNFRKRISHFFEWFSRWFEVDEKKILERVRQFCELNEEIEWCLNQKVKWIFDHFRIIELEKEWECNYFNTIH